MESNFEWCDFIKKIQQDPMKKIDNLTVGKYYKLQDHLAICDACRTIVSEVSEKYKNELENRDSGWYRAQYN